MAFFQHWKVADVVQCVLCHHQVKARHTKTATHDMRCEKGQQPKGIAIIFLMRAASAGLLGIPGLALLASQASLEICLAANMLWKALISYLSRSSMHPDSKLYLIWPCSLMSQLKGLVLPLSMRPAERIFFFCSLVNAGLWRLWSMFKMRGLSLWRSHRRAHFCQQHTVFGRHHYKQWDM